MADIAKLPAPVTSNWDWQVHAACRGLNAAMFFHPDNERGRSKRHREARAKAICRPCPVREACLSWALEVREPYGIWGGLSADEREQILAAGAQKATD
jgi:WhiB family redox-sensing transcriptional regulator